MVMTPMAAAIIRKYPCISSHSCFAEFLCINQIIYIEVHTKQDHKHRDRVDEEITVTGHTVVFDAKTTGTCVPKKWSAHQTPAYRLR